MDRSSSKTKLFLLELIIIILFFAIAAAVCMNMFVKAKTVSDDSGNLTMAVMRAQEAAETIKGAPVGQETDALEGFSQLEGDVYVMYYDAEWTPITEADKSTYQAEVVFREQQDLLTAEISVKKEEETLFSITAEKFIDQNSGDER